MPLLNAVKCLYIFYYACYFVTVFPYSSSIFFSYSLIVELNRSTDLTLKIVNKINFYVGLTGALGMFFVANFQETAVIQIHLFGAILCFGSGCAYMLGQTWISYRMHPLFAGRRIAHIRFALSLGATICFFTALGLGIQASRVFHQTFPDLPSPRPWNRRLTPMPGYTLHCISAFAEWMCALLNVFFLLSYSREFEKIRVQLGVQPLVSHLDQSPFWNSINDLSASP